MSEPYYGLTGRLSRQGGQLTGRLQPFTGIGDHDILRNRDLPGQHPIEAITGLEEALDAKADASHIHDGFVPATRTVNGKALSSDIVLDASDIGALGDDTVVPTKTSDLINDSGFLSQHQDISGKLDTDGDGSDVTVDFTQAGSRANISTGGTLSTAFGRIAKWLSDLGTLAFKNNVEKSDMSAGVQASLDRADTALQSFTESDPTVPAWAKAQNKPTYTAAEVGALPDSTVIPTRLSQLQNDAGYLTEYTEIDPTVPNWARQPNKPSYTAAEVGALPDSTVIPEKVSDLQNDAGYITGYTETDPTVPSWAKQPNKPSYTASEVGALPNTTVIPQKVSDLQNDAGYLTSYTETDPTVPAWAKASSKPSYTAAEVGALPITGGTLTGALTLSGAPTANLHPATKKYVDDIVGDIESLLASI